jgi:DNA-binding MurR/RpiR family transcriptional regulator
VAAESPGAGSAIAASAPPLSTVVRVRSLLPSLPPAERRVAQRVIDDPEGVANSTITELAQTCETSETTVIRFCRAIGFSGYPELRLTLATEAGRAQSGGKRDVGSDIRPDDPLEMIVEKVTYADARAVEETAAQLDIMALKRVVDTIAAARRVDIYGVGASAFVAMDFQQKLHRIGRASYAWADAHIMHTGSTVDTIDALEVARGRGATTVALTNFPRSPITDVADLVLTTAARETTFRSGATASRLAQLTVVDCVFVGVAQRTFEPTRQALELTYEAVHSRRALSERRRR